MPHTEVPSISSGLGQSGASLYKTLPRQISLANQVTEELEKLLVDRHLQPGDRLPAERDLATQFGVSRTVIREAVRALVARGLLVVKPGSGTLIRQPSAAEVSQSINIYFHLSKTDFDYKKVIEVRRLLEVEIAGLAAQRRTAEDLAKLEGILANTIQIEVNREKFVAWDVSFHQALAGCTHNELFVILLESVAGAMAKVREIGFNLPTTPARALKFHSLILEAVRAGDAGKARKAMESHLDEAEDTMRKALHLKKIGK